MRSLMRVLCLHFDQVGPAPEAPAVPPAPELPARPRPILKPEGAIAGAGPRKRKKTVRLAVRDEALTYADEGAHSLK